MMMTDPFLLQVMIHHPQDFPLVRDRGFVIGPGQETFASKYY